MKRCKIKSGSLDLRGTILTTSLSRVVSPVLEADFSELTSRRTGVMDIDTFTAETDAFDPTYGSLPIIFYKMNRLSWTNRHLMLLGSMPQV